MSATPSRTRPPMRPSRAEVWLTDLDPSRGHEQGGTRPAVVISADGFNHGRSGTTTVLPITSVRKGIPFHVEVQPPEGGLDRPSFVKCEDTRAITTERLIRRYGSLGPDSMERIAEMMRALLDL